MSAPAARPDALADAQPPAAAAGVDSNGNGTPTDDHEALRQTVAETQALPGGVPMPSTAGGMSLLPAPGAATGATADGHPAGGDGGFDTPQEQARAEKRALRQDDGQGPLPVENEKPRSSGSGSLTDKTLHDVGVAGPESTVDKGRGLFSRRNRGGEKGKKGAVAKSEASDDKDKDKDQTPALKPVGFFELFKYSTRTEILVDIVGIITAAAAGATQPLMTLIFGALTTSFTNFASRSAIALSTPGPDTAAALAAAAADLKRVSAQDASYLVYIGIGMFIASYVQMVTWQWTGERNSRRIRERYLQAILRQDVAYFDSLGAGEVATRIQSDQNLIQAGISEKVSMVVQYGSTFIVVAFIKSWRLALPLSSILPVIGITGAFMQKFMMSYSANSLTAVADGGSLAEEAISSIRTVHAFGMNKVLQGLFDQHIAKSRLFSVKGAIINAGGLGVMFFAIYAAYALAFYWGGVLITRSQADSGTVITVFLSILIGSFSMAMVAPELTAIGKARGAAAKIFETIERVPTIDSESDEGVRLDTVHGRIEFEDVTFSYPSRPDVPILKQPGLSLVFKAGQTNALVGASGSGKSTIAALILRFYDPLGGRVLLDGVDIKTMNVRWLRQQIGLVSQEPTLFGRSVRANIETGLLGSPLEKLSAEEKFELVKAACVRANAHDFITQLPNGYDTEVGERGGLLSGGQKQRVAIARAIISDPKILILDEATSALDGKSEAVVQDALDKASQGRTTVTVAHRLATIRNSDCIFVMGAGAVLEKGSHNELLANEKGPYAALVQAQALIQEKKEDEADEYLVDQSGSTTPHEEKPAMLRRATTNNSTTASSYGPGIKEEKDESRYSFYYLARRMYRINREDKLIYIGGFLGAIASGCVYPALAILFGKSIAAFSQTDSGELRRQSDRNALWYFISAIASAFAILLQNGCLSRSAESLTAKLRSMTFRAMLRQDIAFFDEEENATGALTSNLSDWPQKFNGLAGVTLGAIIQAVATLVFGMIIGLIFGPLLALIGIACIPLLVTAGYIRLRLVVLKDESNKKAHAASAHLASEAAGAVRTVASLTMEKDCCDVHSRALEAPFRRSIRAAVRNNLLYALSQALSFPVIALVFYVGSRWIASGRIQVANYFTVLNSVVFASIQAGNIFSFVPDASKAQSSSTSIIRLSDQVPEIDCESTEGKVLDDSQVQGHLQIEGVHFRYPSRPAVRVLRGLDVDIPAGWYVALVGPSGCGKSTCIGLLERFYDPLQGQITIDGIPITALNISSYRSQISLVSQEPTLYAGSVRFNILLGAAKPADQVTDEEVVRACKDANIYEFIMSLPDGFDTFVGNKGTQLSGGQKQRIAIARALIRDPKILLLDEATSALDSQSERVVQAAIDNVIRNRSLTVVSIAHRLSTVQNANRIYYFHEGRIAEAGTHQQLIAQKGRYFELTQMQTLSKID